MSTEPLRHIIPTQCSCDWSWGYPQVGDADWIHAGPSGEILLFERKNSFTEFERDKGQKSRNQRFLLGNPNMQIHYVICEGIWRSTINRFVFVVIEHWQLLPDGNFVWIPVIKRFPGNIEDICRKFDLECRIKSIAVNDNNTRWTPDYGKRLKV